ncbi:helix-turn-helix domain-containing protein [Sphingobacterium rhinopitheci]|uniref:helix-turn-helix domain-containing protein n=1 Tax=Sphingobacterium rhinopitheci TaxID=2781960 RepID=UPI001F516FBE|nr:helix-turn-helix domain-containing protein [Sphingobacterium rhinopitheci]MCI0922519.1 helix-turn-helix domain-containing protein [Sphingobacterium rhinopitheci]
MSQIQFIQTTPDQLQSQITESIKNELSEFLLHFRPKQIDEYLTRQEVANMLKINLSTLHDWVKKGKLKSYGIGGRVYFLKSDIVNSLILLTPKSIRHAKG